MGSFQIPRSLKGDGWYLMNCYERTVASPSPMTIGARVRADLIPDVNWNASSFTEVSGLRVVRDRPLSGGEEGGSLGLRSFPLLQIVDPSGPTVRGPGVLAEHFKVRESPRPSNGLQVPGYRVDPARC